MKMESDSSARVIVAEDNPTNRYIICAMLRGLGIDPVVAKDGEEVVEAALATTAPSLILMDINMPKRNGVEAGKIILSTPGFAETPIVAVTANATAQQEQECNEAGFRGFITKPVDADLFEQSVTKFVTSRTAA